MISERNESKATESGNNQFTMDTIIISPLRYVDVKKITNIQDSIESLDETMKQIRQKLYKLHLDRTRKLHAKCHYKPQEQKTKLFISSWRSRNLQRQPCH